MLSLRLFLTNRCNMRCTYCQVKNDGATISWPELQTYLKKNRSFLLENISSVNVLGGEPCLEFDLLENLVILLRGVLGFDRRITMYTNASLIGSYDAGFLEENGIKVVISLDGVKQYNDQERILGGSTSSQFDSALKAIDLFDREKLHIHCTITKKNIEGLPDFFDFLTAEGIRSVGLFPADYVYWSKRDAFGLGSQLEQLLPAFKDKLHFGGLSWLLRQKTSGRRKCDRLYVGANGRFYVCKCFSTLTPEVAGRLEIGSLEEGIDFKKRDKQLQCLYEKVTELEQTLIDYESLKEISAYIYCPINIMLNATYNDYDTARWLRSYYRMMTAFISPFLSLLEKENDC